MTAPQDVYKRQVVDDVRQRVADLRVEQDLDNATELVGQQRQHEQIDDKEDRPRDALGLVPIFFPLPFGLSG